MKSWLPGLLTLAFILLCPCRSDAATWYIKADGTGDAPTIQDGVTAAANGDTVLLAPGTFTGTGNKYINLRSKAITVTSEAGPEATIIDCEGVGNAFDLRGETSSVISGLTIQNGHASHGGGIHCNASSPRIENNIIKDCTALSYGGGMYFGYSHAVVQHNVVTNCSAPKGGGISLYKCASIMTLHFNTITHNIATNAGGGIHFWDSPPTMVNNTLVGNGAPSGGGLFLTGTFSTPWIYRTIIAFGTDGTAIFCGAGAAPTFICCDIFANAGGSALCGMDGGSNFSADPQFCGDSGNGDFWLSTTSPCWVDNSPCISLVGAWPAGCVITGVDGETPIEPQLMLMQNYPNPFNPLTTISFSLPRHAHVDMRIYSVSGQLIKTLWSGEKPGGSNYIVWDGTSTDGRSVSSGVYFLRLESEGKTLSRRLVVVR